MAATGRRLTRDEARRIVIRAQLLDAQRPADLLTVLDQLTMLQLDPTAAIAPSADLVAWSRPGVDYRPEHLQTALERDRTAFEHRAQPVVKEPPLAMLRPMKDLGLHLADMRAGPTSQTRREWMTANAGFRGRVLAQLRDAGPLSSRDITDSAEVPWQSSGWTHDRNVTQMLEFLSSAGEIAVAGRRGRERLWDLAERIYPADIVVVDADTARRRRDERWLRAMGLARAKVVGKLFDFDFTLEMYKPRAKRRWGYYALPVLHGSRMVGKVDAEVDRAASRLRVNALHEDVTFNRTMRSAVATEVRALATWLGLDDVEGLR